MNTKRLLSVLFFFTLLPLSSLANFWQDPETKVYYEYVEGSGIACVMAGPSNPTIGPGSNVSGDINILPSFTVNGKTYCVTSIGGRAFYNTTISGVTIPSTVNSIGEAAFYKCYWLTSANIPEGVTSIGYAAFADCTSLDNITIPSSVVNMSDNAFGSCTGLKKVIIKEGVTLHYKKG